MANINAVIASLDTLYTTVLDALDYECDVKFYELEQSSNQDESIDSLCVLKQRFDDWYEGLRVAKTSVSSVQVFKSLDPAVKP